MSLAIRLMPEVVRSADFAAIAASWPAYMGVGTAVAEPIRMFVIQNMTDANLMFSFDGINDHIPLPSWGYLLLDIASNKTISQGFFLAEGQRLYVKQLTAGEIPTLGAVYLTTFYGAEI